MPEEAKVEESRQEEQTRKEKQEERLFTQEELDRIVKERLARQKASAEAKADNEAEAKAKEFESRELDLKQRESRLACKEYLLEKGFSEGLLDVIGTEDVDAFKKKAEKLEEIYGGSRRRVPPLASTEPAGLGKDSIADAFRNPSHRPKPFEIQ